MDIAPNLGIETTAVGVEDAYHAPQVAAEFDLLTDLRATESRRYAAADDDLARAPFEHSTLDDPNLWPQLKRSFIHAPNRDVADSLRAEFREIDNHNRFLRAQWTAVR